MARCRAVSVTHVARGMMDDPIVGVLMGSRSDWETMAVAVETLSALEIPSETRVISAHRTPDVAFEYAASAESRGLRVIIAAAGGAAHLAGVMAAKTVLPVLGVPIQSRALQGLDSLLSIVQMPGGIPVGTLAIGKAGAVNSRSSRPRSSGLGTKRCWIACAHTGRSGWKRYSGIRIPRSRCPAERHMLDEIRDKLGEEIEALTRELNVVSPTGSRKRSNSGICGRTPSTSRRWNASSSSRPVSDTSRGACPSSPRSIWPRCR